MHKLLLLCCLLVTTSSSVYAQKELGRVLLSPVSKVGQNETLLNGINISRQLKLRVDKTFQQAQELQKQLPQEYNLLTGEPIQKIYSPQILNPQELYPHNTFLKTHKQTGNYLIARNNRLFLREVRRMKQIWAQVNENLPRLQQEAQATEQPENQVSWLVEAIPPQTTQLFIGEMHGYPEISRFMSRLLPELRTQYPSRKIILFTEFLPENLKWTGQRPSTKEVLESLHSYYPIWDSALQAQIEVIGLEIPVATKENDCCEVRYTDRQGGSRKQRVWASLEGIRLRNERWKKTLATYREKYPEALFVIYTGSMHSLYNAPFTLAHCAEQTFVSVLYPERYVDFESSNRISELEDKPMPGPLESLIDQMDFHRSVVKWQSPDLPAIAGFNARIKIPVSLPYIDY